MWRWFDYTAQCQQCGWRCSKKNALGLAAQHHDRHQHSVSIEVIGQISYLSDADDKKLRNEKKQ